MTKTLPRYTVDATVATDEIYRLADKAVNDPQFSHRDWHLFHADTFSRLAAKIRNGYDTKAGE